MPQPYVVMPQLTLRDLACRSGRGPRIVRQAKSSICICQKEGQHSMQKGQPDTLALGYSIGTVPMTIQIGDSTKHHI
jgi:hypothetical protein